MFCREQVARERVANTHNRSEREIAALFLKSEAYSNLPDSVKNKVTVAKDFVWEYKCPCMKRPRINECVDLIKSNIEYGRTAVTNILSRVEFAEGGGGGDWGVFTAKDVLRVVDGVPQKQPPIKQT